MRNLDDRRRPTLAEDERQFVLMGRTFTVRDRVMPEAQATIEDTLLQASAVEVLNMQEEAFLQYLVPGDHDKWREIRADTERVVEYHDLNLVMEFMLEVTTSRPTEAPAASSNGRAGTAATSGAASSPLELTPTP